MKISKGRTEKNNHGAITMELSGGDLKSLLEIVDLAYGASGPDALFTQLFEKLERVIGVSSATFLPMGGEGLRLKAYGSLGLHLRKSVNQEYAAYYAPLDPYLTTGWFKQPNRAIRNTDLMPAKDLKNCEFGVDFLASVPCFYGIASTLGTPEHLMGVIGLHRLRHERNFSDRDVAFMNAFLPHLSRALLTFEKLNRQPHATGIVILDGRGTVVYMNETATRILNGRPPEVIPLPIGRSPLCQEKAIFQTDLGNYTVAVKTIPYQYKVVSLEPSNCDHDCLSSRLAHLGLTARQQEIAARVLQGLCNKTIASELRLTEQTVKDHLKVIFKKLGIHHRAELAARVLPVPVGIAVAAWRPAL